VKPKGLLLSLCVAATIVAAVARLSLHLRAKPDAQASAQGTAGQAAAAYAGSDACKECHAREYEAWRGSQHQLAMQNASDSTVLGNFRDSRFSPSSGPRI